MARRNLTDVQFYELIKLLKLLKTTRVGAGNDEILRKYFLMNSWVY